MDMSTNNPDYQHDFAKMHPGMYDRGERGRKATTMLCVLREVLGPNVATSNLLNVGSSSGIVDAILAEAFESVTGIDIDADAIKFARQSFQRPNLHFEQADGLDLPFPDGRFDVVVCCQVYEHVPDQSRLMAEIERVLRPGGVCYFAATNRFILVEPHYRLWFLSWLPPRFADLYLRLMGKGKHYYERMRSLQYLRRLVSRFVVTDYTSTILRDPARYHVEYMVKPDSVIQWFAVLAASRLRWIFPGYIWLLTKRGAAPHGRGA